MRGEAAAFERRRARALLRFARVVGADGVRDGSADLGDYFDPYPFGNRGDFAPGGVVSPASTEEVQAILRIANEEKVPLWTVSQGRNLGYGGAAPRLNGSVVLELRRMNRVLEVDEASGYAVVEPGVRFFDLYDHLRAGGHRLWISAPALGWGSVVGNALERGFGFHAYADHETNICGMEVVLPTGELVRTGMGAMENNPAWHLNRGGFGPSVDGLFLQSNLGVVTRMGMWLMPTPECFHICEVKFERDEDLGPMVDTLRPLKLDGTIPARTIALNAVRIAQGLGPRARWWDGRGALPPEVLDQIRREYGIGAWTLVFGLYGDEAVVDAQLNKVRTAFEAIPGAAFSSRKYPGDVAAAELEPRHHVFAGVPTMEHLAILNWSGPEGAHLGFSPISPLKGDDANRQARQVREAAARFGFDYGAAFSAIGRRLNHVFMIVFDRTDAEETGRARQLFDLLVREGAKDGYGEYRTHLAYMDLVAAQYGFNDHAQMRLNQVIKDALDPNGVLSPGKQGIWPRWRRDDPSRPFPPG